MNRHGGSYKTGETGEEEMDGEGDPTDEHAGGL